jgi:di/tricarboxylate transporter
MTFQAWLIVAVLLGVVIAFCKDKWPIDLVAIITVAVLLLIGHLFPVFGPDNKNLLNSDALLAGFGNAALLTIMALFVVGEGLVQTDAIRMISRPFTNVSEDKAYLSLQLFLIVSMVLSAFMNNIPQVVIAIPIVQVLAAASRTNISKVLMPMNALIILGGMPILLGSSTNLLVVSSARNHGIDHAFTVFDFVVPGTILAVVGTIYALTVMPKQLAKRKGDLSELDTGGETYLAEVDVTAESGLIGMTASADILKDATLRMVHRGPGLIDPPFGDFAFMEGDTLLVSADKETLTNLISRYRGHLTESLGMSDTDKDAGELILAEAVVPPGSRLKDLPADLGTTDIEWNVRVIGVSRRSIMLTTRLSNIRLEAGDTLLLAGQRDAVEAIGNSKEVLLMSGSKRPLPSPKQAPVALAIFTVAITVATMGWLPLEAAAISAAVAMVATGCLSLRQSGRAMNREIYILGAGMLALGTALEATGVFQVTVDNIVALPYMDSPLLLIAALFGLIAMTTNLLSNNACAVLFTPIVLMLADRLQIDPMIMLALLIMAANCSFATPVGYMTNLLVMGPGKYKTSDYLRTGTPLVLILWVTFVLIAAFYYKVPLESLPAPK